MKAELTETGLAQFAERMKMAEIDDDAARIAGVSGREPTVPEWATQ